jgi:hypothetical protein
MRRVRVAPYDPSFYSFILFAENDPVRVKNGDRYDIRFQVEQSPEAYYHGQVQPLETILSFGSEKWLIH